MAIIISKNGHEAKKVERTTFNKEDDLQKYLSDNPETLPVDQIREGTKILVLAREFPTQAGPIDILAVDELGTLYVIETKLYATPTNAMSLHRSWTMALLSGDTHRSSASSGSRWRSM